MNNLICKLPIILVCCFLFISGCDEKEKIEIPHHILTFIQPNAPDIKMLFDSVVIKNDTMHLIFTTTAAVPVKIVDISVSRILLDERGRPISTEHVFFFESFYPNAIKPIIDFKFPIPDDFVPARKVIENSNGQRQFEYDNLEIVFTFKGNKRRYYSGYITMN